MDLTCNMGDDPSVINKLDSLEKRIFIPSNKAQIKFNNWMLSTGVQIEAANMVVNHRKRKRIALEEI